MKRARVGVIVYLILSFMIALMVVTINTISDIASGQSDDLERKQIIYSVVEKTLKEQYETFMSKAKYAPYATDSQRAINAATLISTMDLVDVTNDIFEREQLKGEVLDNKSIASEVALIVLDEVVTGAPNFRNLLP